MQPLSATWTFKSSGPARTSYWKVLNSDSDPTLSTLLMTVLIWGFLSSRISATSCL